MRFLGESVTVLLGIRTWALIGSLTVFLTFIFVADASITTWRRGDREALIVGGTVQFLLLVGLSSSLMVAWAGWIRRPSPVAPGSSSS